MKRIITLILCMFVILTACTPQIALAKAYYVEYQDERFTYRDWRVLEDRIAEQTDRMAAAHNMAEAARTLGYDEGHAIIETAQEEYRQASIAKDTYQSIYENLQAHWEAKEKEYPTAAYVWKFLADQGYNDEVVAGIIGNMMVEVGGHTLNLDHTLSTPSYYGLCQWSKGYPDVWGKDLEEQCKFLESTIQYELDTYGYMYKKGYNYEDFLLMNTPQEAALMFAKSYERCSSSTYKLRQQLAAEAYNYFVT